MPAILYGKSRDRPAPASKYNALFFLPFFYVHEWMALTHVCIFNKAVSEQKLVCGHALSRGTSLIRNSSPLGPYSRTIPRALWWAWGGGAFSYERDAPSCIPTQAVSEQDIACGHALYTFRDGQCTGVPRS